MLHAFLRHTAARRRSLHGVVTQDKHAACSANRSSLLVNCPPSEVRTLSILKGGMRECHGERTLLARTSPYKGGCFTTGVLPACRRGKSDKVRIRKLLLATWELITQQLPGNNGKRDIPITETIRGLYRRDPTVNNWILQKKNPAGSLRTFSTPPPNPAASASRQAFTLLGLKIGRRA